MFVDGEPWGENLEALDNLLYGGFRQIPSIVLVDLETRARDRAPQLGYAETVRHLTLQSRDCHPTVLIKTAWALRAASKGTRSDSIRLDSNERWQASKRRTSEA